MTPGRKMHKPHRGDRFHLYHEDCCDDSGCEYVGQLMAPAELRAFAEEIWEAARDGCYVDSASGDVFEHDYYDFADYWKERG